MSRAIDILLEEILEAIELVQRYTEGLSYEDFEANVEKQDSVLRRLEVIGEAVKGIPWTCPGLVDSSTLSAQG